MIPEVLEGIESIIKSDARYKYWEVDDISRVDAEGWIRLTPVYVKNSDFVLADETAYIGTEIELGVEIGYKDLTGVISQKKALQTIEGVWKLLNGKIFADGLTKAEFIRFENLGLRQDGYWIGRAIYSFKNYRGDL